jgi:hypothetical protein
MRYRTLGRTGIGGGDMRPRRRAAGRTVTVDDAVARALDIGPGSSTAERTIDVTTLGRCSGIPRRIEVWFHRVDGRWYLTGMPGPRSWYANLRANPRSSCISSTGSRPTCRRPRGRSTSRPGGG